MREWASSVLLALLIFVFDYGLLFWAEQRVPSGIAAFMLAAIPALMTLLIGYFFAGEELGSRTALGTICLLISVIVIATARAAKQPLILTGKEKTDTV